MTTDVPLLFCYALGSWCLWRALTANQWRWWLGFGAALGFGILAKFAAAMTLVSLALLLAIRHRAQILNPRLWAALGVAVLIYAPNLYWQLQHDFASYRHVGQDAKVEGSGLNLLSVAEFLGAQFGVFGPLLFAALIALLARPLASGARLMLAALILPQLVLMAGVAVLGEANANWAAMVYAPATVMVAVWAIGPGRLQRVVLAGSLALHLPLAILAPVAEPAARMVGVDLPGDPFRRLRGWDALGSAVAQALDQDPHAVLLVEERMLFAQLAFTVRPEPEMAMWNPNRRIDNHFELTSDIDRFPGRRFVLVAWSPEPTGITRHFEHWTLDRSVTVPIGGGRVRRHFIHRLEGYRGRS
jgi:hypothetical protein